MNPNTIIAEIGVNFRDMDEARIMIREAAHAGVDAVKFQVYDDSIVKNHPRFEELMHIRLTESKIQDLAEFAKTEGVEFIATPMFPGAVDWLAPHVKTFKVRYEDRHNVELFDAIASCNVDNDKKVIISCDDAYFSEQNKAKSKILTTLSRNKVLYVYMLCTRASAPGQKPMAHVFHDAGYTGYSSHGCSIAAPLIALCRGASIIEVHVKRGDHLYNLLTEWVSFDDGINMYELEQFIKIKTDMEALI